MRRHRLIHFRVAAAASASRWACGGGGAGSGPGPGPRPLPAGLPLPPPASSSSSSGPGGWAGPGGGVPVRPVPPVPLPPVSRCRCRRMWYIMQSVQSKYSLSERLIRTIAAIRSFPRDNVEDLIGRVSPGGAPGGEPGPVPPPPAGPAARPRRGNAGPAARMLQTGVRRLLLPPAAGTGSSGSPQCGVWSRPRPGMQPTSGCGRAPQRPGLSGH